MASHDIERVGLTHIHCARVADVRADAADVLERDGHHLVARRDLEIGHDVFEVEAERHVLTRVAVVVDVNLVDGGSGFQVEVVGTAVRVLQREVVREQRHVAFASGLVAAKHVEVGAVDPRDGRDERRFTVARCVNDRADGQHGG